MNVTTVKPGLHCDISTSILKHEHNECSHLHKHKESDMRKRKELQNEVVGVWDEARFQKWRETSLLLCRCQTPFYPQFAIISETCECSVTNTNTKDFFYL